MKPNKILSLTRLVIFYPPVNPVALLLAFLILSPSPALAHHCDSLKNQIDNFWRAGTFNPSDHQRRNQEYARLNNAYIDCQRSHSSAPSQGSSGGGSSNAGRPGPSLPLGPGARTIEELFRPSMPSSQPAPAPRAPSYDPEVERRNRAIDEELARNRAEADRARTEYDRSRETSNRGADEIANMLRNTAREATPPTDTPRGQSDSPRQAAADQGLSCFSLASDDKKWLGQDSVIASNDCDKSVMVKVCFRGTQACNGDTVPPGQKSRIANMNEGGSTSIRYWTCVKADYDAGRCRLP